METSAFEGRVTFITRYRTQLTEIICQRILAAVAEKYPDMNANEINVASVCCLVLSCTSDIRFNYRGDEPDELLDLQRFWTWFRETIVNEDSDLLTTDIGVLAQVWKRYARQVGFLADRAWYNSYSRAKTVFPAPPEIAHPNLLTPEQKNDPNLKKDDAPPGSE